MRVTCSTLKIRASVLAGIAGLASIPAWADETKIESKSQSSTAEVEVRVERNNQEGKPASEKDQQQVTVVLAVSGDPSDAVKTAIEKLEKQLKGSGIPESLQKKALESLRSQSNQQAAEGKDAKSKEGLERRVQSNRVEFRLPFGRTNQEVSSTMGPAQKKKLRNAISEALEQSGVASEVIEKALGNVDKSLDEINAQGNAWRPVVGNLPYRVGIGCKLNEAGDSTPGLEVETVFEESPAALAGLKPGDRLISIDKQPIDSHDDIVSAVQKAGEENRSIQLEVMRGGNSTVYEIKPEQTAVAELHTGPFQPGANFGFGSTGQAWVMPSWPQNGSGPMNDPKLHEKYREALKEAVDVARRASDKLRASEGSREESVSLEDRNEKNIDELRNELAAVQKDLEEIKDALKKLTEKQ